MILKFLVTLTAVVSVLTFFRAIYTVLGFFFRSKTFPPAKKALSYGIVIAARNEEAVIGRLLDSIRRQDYDPSKIKVFVVADNCTDRTAQICREAGATVYERTDPSRVRKGYALQYLFDKIKQDFGIDSLDAYLIFDADNLLRKNFVTEINAAFSAGAELCIGYRATKNFDESFVSAAYGIHFMRSVQALHRPRTVLGLSTHIAGTGWGVRSSLLRGGWDCTYLTEDTQFTMKCVTSGLRVEFCEAAEFYDEQPHTLRIALRQRLRWIKGRLCCFASYAGKLLSGIFRPSSRPRTRAICYDMFFYLFPGGLFTALCSTVPAFITAVSGLISAGFPEEALRHLLLSAVVSLATFWAGSVLGGGIALLRERKHLRLFGSKARLIFFLFLWPWFDLIEVPLAIFALFRRVGWKPIRHDFALSISQMEPEEATEQEEEKEKEEEAAKK